MSIYVLDVLAIVGAVICMCAWSLSKRRHAHVAPLPPGPKGLPIIGNVLDMPVENQWETMRQWGAKYGDLVYVTIFGTRYLFLNSYESAIELFERRGNIYSSRPQTPMLNLEGWSEWFTSLIPYGDRLRRSRQFVNKFFQRSVVKDHYEMQTQSTHKLLLKLLQEPDKFCERIAHWAADTIIKITYGFEITENDPNVELIDQGIRTISEAMEFSAVNYLPALYYLPSWFPGTQFHEKVQEGRRLSIAMRNEPYNEAKRKMAEGKAVPSMLSKLEQLYIDREGSCADKDCIAQVVAVTYGAGGDTTVATTLTFLLAMVLYPDVMKRGQEELNRAIGTENLPTFDDRPKLPYIDAICSECMRWQTVLPLGVPHVAEKDDIYNGYFIPAGTAVIGNAWAMLRDPARYPDPEKFVPERWLAESGKEQPLEANRVAFGFGRRICPGRFFAENSLFIGVASILAVFDVQKAINEHGVPITPDEDFISTFVRHPKPFKCSITPRSADAVKLIHLAASAASVK